MTDAAPPVPRPPRRPRRPRTPVGWVVLAVVVLVAVVAMVGVTARFGVLLPQARLMIEARASGVKLGRVGRLQVEGLSGDIWRNFAVRKLTIRDEKGVWLRADNVQVKWSYLALFNRRLAVDDARAARVTVFRRPTLTPKGKSKGLPVNFDIDHAAFRLETLPAFSSRRGLFDVDMALHLERGGGGQFGEVRATSLLHRGDRLAVKFDVSKIRPLLIDAEAYEAEGGALAGSLGLPANRPFSALAKAGGTRDSGRLALRIFSGVSAPALIDGAWTADGGSVTGVADLSASSLLKSYVAMFGPRLQFTAAARKSSGGLHGIGLRAFADNLRVKARGRVNFVERSSPEGLQVDVAVPQLTRIVDWRFLGAGRVVGRLKGSPAAWSIAGSTAVDGVQVGDYRLVRVTGPATLAVRDGILTAQATLQGAGGGGKGVLAGLAGAAPRVFIDLTRFKDGRVLIRSLKLVGAGVRVDASGSRGLLGGLDFKGDLTVTNLAVARRGAAGAVSASWTARQGGAGKPWLVSADARGSRFRSGMAELDRLLGPSPRLKAQASYRGGVFNVSRADLSGAAASAGVRGVIGPRGAMKLAVSWRASGPFQAGPLEVTGAMTGSGLVGGSFSRPKADLIADFARLDLPNLPLRRAHAVVSFQRIAGVYDGLFSLTGDSDYGPARARSAFRFMPGGLDLSGLEADAAGVQATGAVSLRGGAPSTANLTVAAGPGALLTRGRAGGTVLIVTQGAAARASIDIEARDAVLRGGGFYLRAARLQADGPLSRLPFTLSADGRTGETPFSVQGTGGYARVGKAQTIRFEGEGAVRRVAARTAEPVTISIGPDGRVIRARLIVGGGRASLDARDGKGGLTATGALQDIELTALTDGFAGRIDADFNLRGRGDRLDGLLTARLQNARATGEDAALAMNGDVRAQLSDERLAVRANLTGAQGMTATADVVLPAETSAAPLRIAVARTRPMSGSFAIDGEVRPLWNAFQGGERELAGRLRMNGRLGGTLNDPRITGQASLAGGRLEDYSTGLKLTDLALDADLRSDAIAIRSLSARDGGEGTIAGSGQISLLRGGGSTFKIDFTRFRLIDNDTAEATASGQVSIVRAADGKARITGQLAIDRAEINAETKLKPSVVSIEVVERNRPQTLVDQLPPPKAGAALATLDISLRAPRRVFIKGRGIDAELSLNARVTGTTSRPEISGVARVFRGSYDFAGKRFEFEERGEIRLANRADEIRLDLTATLQEATVTANLRVRGTAARPEITLTSTPSLPQDEILAQVIFGRSASQLSGVEAAQLASTLTALATGGGFDVLGSLRQFARLDRLTFGTDEAQATTVAGGKYVSDDVYLEIVGGGVDGPKVRVDWRVRRNFSILSELATEGGAKVTVRWRRDIRDRRGGRGERVRARQASPSTPQP